MKVCIITGASSGIGEALALELAKRGYAVGLMARRTGLLDELAAKIQGMGGRACAVAADVTDGRAVQAAVEQIEQSLGPCTLLIANAGGDVRGKKPEGPTNHLGSIDYDGILGTMRLNYDGVVNTLAAVVPGMEQRKAGSVAVVSSIASMRGIPGFAAYGASKAAVSQLCEGLRVQLAPKGIVVTTIQPGYIKTPLTAKNKTPMPFLMEADEAARRIANAIEAQTAVYTFPLPMKLLMSFAASLPPFLWDRIIGKAVPKS